VRNDRLLESPVNKYFEEILHMTAAQFRQWVIDLRKTVVEIWDTYGLPPRVGFSDEEIADQFRKMCSFDTRKFRIEDDVIRNNSILGNAVNDFFPTMMKTRITYTNKDDAKSIYDFFADDALLERFMKYATRHFRRDSFFHYSDPVSVGDTFNNFVCTEDPHEFLQVFNHQDEYGIFLQPVNIDTFIQQSQYAWCKDYTGYNQKLRQRQNYVVDADFMENCGYPWSQAELANVDYNKSKYYKIHLYKYGQKLFPIGFVAFRVSYCQSAVNFPPLTARYLYEEYTKHIQDQEVIKLYDPSAGWGGRLLGALASNPPGKYHYIGTDPNTDHGEGYTTYHRVGEFFDRFVRSDTGLWGDVNKNTYEIHQFGSEVIGDQMVFQKHLGTVDLVFTSPPYFAKEVYSDDPEQSCHKFSSYESWRDGFLFPTLKTAVASLRRDRYLLWNIADAVFDGRELPLEADSCRMLETLGMEFVTKLKMTLAQMPGGNRFEETDEKIQWVDGVYEETKKETVVKGKMKNAVQVEKRRKKTWLKFEPILIYRKP
jgi:hypothetical protein